MPVTCDLGILEGPVLLFGGPCSNLHATEALIATARERGIPPQRMICTGDVCAYAAEPEETAQAIRALGCPVVAGNCEKSVGADADDCACDFEAGTACDIFSGQWFAHAKRETSPESKSWMLARPDRVLFEQAGRRYAVIHGGASQINAFIWPVDHPEKFAAEIAILESEYGALDGVICGHSGVPFAKTIGGVLWVNAGSIGLPPHDGDPRTAYAILYQGDVTLHRLSYDHEGAAQAMEAAGLTSGYQHSLRTGWWPSEDSFPGAMRRGVTSLTAAAMA